MTFLISGCEHDTDFRFDLGIDSDIFQVRDIKKCNKLSDLEGQP